MDKVVIADTSCLIALDKIDHLHILKHLFSVVNITKQVNQEFGNPLPDWFIVHEITSLEKLNLILDPGEASALTLALSFQNPLVIIDEKKGRKVAIEMNIAIAGTLKILLLAKQKSIIPSITPLIAALESYSFRFSKSIVAELPLIAGEI